ncbi:alpha-L-glutamate ligase-like protein [Candidatus Binatia bacterium]|nr:alpha-L-glutamate ligase-like protein [Candidatus Binatia bacterium]
MVGLYRRVRRLRREVLGINRRNGEVLLRVNPQRLVALVDDKARTKAVLVEHGIPVPVTFGAYTSTRQLGDLLDEAMRRQEFVLKPARGAGGEGILVVVGRRAERFLTAGGAQVSAADLLSRAADILAGAFAMSQARDQVILEERLVPERTLAAYTPGGVADVRVVVFHGVPIMAMARLPTRQSAGRANLHVGGIGVGLELATGRAVHAIRWGKEIARHPDTGQELAGLRIPAWSEVVRIAAASHDAVPLGYFGIDIVIDARRGPVVLELNARPGLAIQLATGCGLRPLLTAVEARHDACHDVAARISLGLGLAGDIEGPIEGERRS